MVMALSIGFKGVSHCVVVMHTRECLDLPPLQQRWHSPSPPASHPRGLYLQEKIPAGPGRVAGGRHRRTLQDPAAAEGQAASPLCRPPRSEVVVQGEVRLSALQRAMGSLSIRRDPLQQLEGEATLFVRKHTAMCRMNMGET